jgi:hypothetical protein
LAFPKKIGDETFNQCFHHLFKVQNQNGAADMERNEIFIGTHQHRDILLIYIIVLCMDMNSTV